MDSNPAVVQAEEARPSSRDSVSGAGWDCQAGHYRDLMTKADRPFSWVNPLPLLKSRNDRLIRWHWFRDATNDRRRAWVESLALEDSDFLVGRSRPDNEASFLVAGDTGEGDDSQFATVLPELSEADGTDFLFICSDVIYPAGGIGDYLEKFFRPYENYPAAIYAVPGNHDWYDDLTGFMSWFCHQDQAPPWPNGRSFRDRLRRRLWRKAPRADPAKVDACLKLRQAPYQQEHPQPGPYLAIDTGPVLLVGIDTGIMGDIDREQADWLKRISKESPKPKILLTGKPLYVDGNPHPGNIEAGPGEDPGTVDEIVTEPEHNYIAAIGGDIHNYQRYPITLKDGRTLMYLVTGGGGAFMHETHTIPNINKQGLGLSEEHFRCYPLRGDSLSRFSQLYARKMRWIVGPLWRRLYLKPDVAAAIMSEGLGVDSTRSSAEKATIRRRDRFAAWLIFKIHHRAQRGLHVPFSEWLDWNKPPMFKHFLRVDAKAEEVRIRCFAATGCVSQENQPPVEDDLVARLGPSGTWEWTLPSDARRSRRRDDNYPGS